MKYFFSLIFFIFFIAENVQADEAADWLKTEIDFILQAYENKGTSDKDRFLMIENTINYNFAGAGIAKFVSGNAWLKADKNTKKEYIELFKRHLALTIASMMQGYSKQTYKLINSKYDKKNKVSLIDMEIYTDTGSLLVTWRVKQSKNRFYVIDLIVADISLVVTKRDEFNSLLKNVDYNLKEFNILLKNQNEESYNKVIN